MALETGTYINDLNTNNPPGSDGKSQGDEHIRLLKSTIKTTFVNITGEVSATHTELNLLDGCTATTAELNKLAGYSGDIPTTGGGNFPNVNADVTATDDQISKLGPQQEGVVDATNGGADDLTEIDWTAINALNGSSGSDHLLTRVQVLFKDISLDGTENLLVQIGDSDGFQTSNYESTSTSGSGADVTSTSGFIISAGAAARSYTGILTITTIDPDNHEYIAECIHKDDNGDCFHSAGSVVFTAGMGLIQDFSQIRFTTTGSDAFDGGKVNVLVDTVGSTQK